MDREALEHSLVTPAARPHRARHHRPRRRGPGGAGRALHLARPPRRGDRHPVPRPARSSCACRARCPARAATARSTCAARRCCSPGPRRPGAGHGQRLPPPRRAGRRRGGARPGGSPARSTPGCTTSTGHLVGVPVAERLRGPCAARRRAWSSCRSPRATGWSSAACGPGPPVDIDAYLGPDLAEELALLDFAELASPTATPTSTRWGPTGRSRSTPSARTTTSTTCTGHAEGLRLRRRPHLRRLRRRTCATARRSARSTSCATVPRTSGATWPSTSATSTRCSPTPASPSTAGTSSCGRSCRSTPAHSEVIHTAYMRPGLPDAEREPAGGDGPVDLRDRRRRRGLLGRRPHRARACAPASSTRSCSGATSRRPSTSTGASRPPWTPHAPTAPDHAGPGVPPGPACYLAM